MRSEFEFIRNIKEKHALGRVGDDCAVVPKDSKTDLVITADMIVEDIDFRLEWTSPDLLGHKALAVSLSDIAAMGGTPKWAMLSVGLPETTWGGKFIDEFYAGWFKLADKYDVELIGGDVSRTTDKIVIDSIAAGDVAKGAAIIRSGARPGDSIFVTGALGGAAGGLSLLEAGIRFGKVRGKRRALLSRQLAPSPRVEIGEYLSSRSIASSMIDVSDGLAADLYHICDASGVGAIINLGDLPLDAGLEPNSMVEKQAFALGGGEDFELLFTSREKKIMPSKLARITRIGEVTANVGIVELVCENSKQILPRIGYRHF
jgi:thiamine-monophosphate kinase